jgi:hypothetical protein
MVDLRRAVAFVPTVGPLKGVDFLLGPLPLRLEASPADADPGLPMDQRSYGKQQPSGGGQGGSSSGGKGSGPGAPGLRGPSEGSASRPVPKRERIKPRH